jgi:hypothetical protein
MDSSPSKNKGFKLDIAAFDGSTVHMNLAQEIIVISSDRIKLCLQDYKRIIESGITWVAPAGILITVLTALVTTASYKSFLGLNAKVWETIFIVGLISCIIWLGRCVYFAWKSRGKRSDDYIIGNLKIGAMHICGEEDNK